MRILDKMTAHTRTRKVKSDTNSNHNNSGNPLIENVF